MRNSIGKKLTLSLISENKVVKGNNKSIKTQFTFYAKLLNFTVFPLVWEKNAQEKYNADIKMETFDQINMFNKRSTGMT